MRKLKEEQPGGFRLNIEEYWRVVWRKKYFVIVPLLIAVAVSNVGTRFLIPVFEASTVVRVGERSEAANAAPFMQDRAQRRSRDAETMARLNTDLTSSAFLDELIVRLGLSRDPNLMAAAERQRERLHPDITTEELVMRRLRGVITQRVRISRESPSTFRIAYSDANPEACYVIANAMTDLYVEVQQRQKIQGLQRVSDFSDEQLALYKERLQRSERNLEQFKNEMSKSIDASNPVTMTNIGVAESIERRLVADVGEGNNILSNLQERLQTHIGEVPQAEHLLKDREVENLRDELLAQVHAELLSQLQGAAPSGTATLAHQQEINTTQQALLNRVTELIRIEFPDVHRDYRPLIDEYYYQMIQVASRERKLEKLREYIASYRRNLEMAPRWESELARLQTEVDSDRELYNRFKNSKTSTQISEAVQSTALGESVIVLEEARRPLAPVRPNKLKIIIMAVAFGLTLGVGGVLVTEVSDSSYRSVDEIENQLGLKVLGTVPRFESSKVWYDQSRFKRTFAWVTVSVLVVAVSLMGFYFYGKSSKENMINVNVTQTNQR
jgi:uncharacterized protein involved in exopolysaccharide biosynthesis